MGQDSVSLNSSYVEYMKNMESGVSVEKGTLSVCGHWAPHCGTRQLLPFGTSILIYKDAISSHALIYSVNFSVCLRFYVIIILNVIIIRGFF